MSEKATQISDDDLLFVVKLFHVSQCLSSLYNVLTFCTYFKLFLIGTTVQQFNQNTEIF